MPQTGRTKAVLVSMAISMALYASGLLVIFTPLPLLYVAVARSRGTGIAAAFAALAAVAAIYAVILFRAGMGDSAGALPVPAMNLAAFFSPRMLWGAGVGYFVFFVAVALALSEGVRRRFGLVKCGGVALAAGIGIMVLLVGAGALVGAGESGGLKGYLTELVGQIAAMNEQAGGGTEFSSLREGAPEIVAFLQGIAPSLVFVFVLLTVVVNMLLARRLIRGKHAFAHIHNVARFRLPDAAVWAVVAGGIAFFADSYALHSGVLKMVAINVLICFCALYFFQGLAVVVYFLQGLRMPLMKTMAYVAIIFFFQTVGVVIVAIGVADVWADFRLRSWKARHEHQA